jgi:hypothetical protein
MKEYEYFTIGSKDEYGQAAMTEDTQGTIRLSINTLSTTVGNNINYKDATYIALTRNKNIDDSYVIKYGEERLKVLYIIPDGRYVQVFLAEM